MIALLYIIPLSFQKLKKYNYNILFYITIIYVFLQKSSSDYHTYEWYFINAGNGLKVTGLEPIYPLLAKIWGIFLPVSEVAFPFFIITISGTLLFFIKKEVLKELKIDESQQKHLFVYILILTFYIIVYQISFNFRGGIATLFFTLSYMYYKRKRYLNFFLFSLISILTHIQVLPIVAFLFGMLIIKRKKVFLLSSFVVLVLIFINWNLVSHFFLKFVVSQGIRYLSTYSGKVRIAVIPYIIIDLLILYRSYHSKEFLKPISLFNVQSLVMFHLLIQVIFFFNSHISSRLVRPIEPLILCGLYHSLVSDGNKKIERILGSIIVFIPGITFVTLQFLLGI